ncbi:MAG: CpsB/CapC family capsule biosynthesis tyrosine phosphatase [Rubripirellula sp.]
MLEARNPSSTVPLADANSGMLTVSNGGGVNWPRTLRFAQQACQDGVTHAVVSSDRSDLETLLQRMPHLKGLLQQHELPIHVTPMVELTLQADLFEQVIYLSLLVGGVHRRYVFLRNQSAVQMPIVPVVQTLKQMHLTTVLLAPERQAHFREDDRELKQIIAGGGLIQLSAASLLDQTDTARVQWCRRVIRSGLCHFVASESGRHHDLPISLQQAYQTIRRWTNQSVADRLCRQNSMQMFAGDAISVAPPKQDGLLAKFQSQFHRAA